MIHGIINVDKEKGFTSHDVVAKLRGIAHQKKVGHTGTLDPDATGVLPVCLGKATKLCDMLTDKDKTYQAVLLLGVETDTQDTSGETLMTCPTEHLEEDKVRACIQSFVGDYEQVPPMYSALKVNGRKLYELAREGKTIERKARPVVIHNIEITDISLPRVEITVSCSKGTYIRTLCHDIGQKLEVGGCMESLRRTKVSRFVIEDSLSLSEIERISKEGNLSNILVPIDAMFEEYPALHVKEAFMPLLYNGNVFEKKAVADQELEKIKLADKEQVRVYREDGLFIAIYAWDQQHQYFKIVKMFCDLSQR